MKIFRGPLDRRRMESSLHDKDGVFTADRFTPEGLAALAMCGVHPRTLATGVFVTVPVEISRALLELEDEE